MVTVRKALSVFIALVMAAAFFGCDKKSAELSAPKGLAYSDGVIRWESVEGADSYDVSVLRGGGEIASDNTAETSYSAEFDAGEYVVRVTAVAQDGAVLSDPAELSFTVYAPVKLTKLKAPTNIIYDGGYLSWDSNAEASAGFTVTVYGADGAKVIEEIVGTAEISVGTLSDGTYKAAVKANEVVNYFEESAETEKQFTVRASETQTPLTAMPSAENVAYNTAADAIVWNVAQGNNGYTAEVIQDGVRVLYYDGLQERMSLSSLPLGAYTAKVTVCGDGRKTSDAVPAELEFEILSKGAIPVPSGLKAENGYLTWNKASLVRSTRITVTRYGTGEPVACEPKFLDETTLFLTDLVNEDGLYNVGVSFISNRYDSEESAMTAVGVTIESAAEYTAAQIAAFSGELPFGEHGAVSLVSENGEQYAEVRPTADGWGRVASPQFSLDFDKNPICFMEVGYVFGGYHLQLQTGDLNFYIVRDTNKLGNANGDIASATGLTGRLSDVRLRIGVNSSTTETANDARVRYKKLSVKYVSEIVPPEPCKLDPVRDMTLSDGAVTWSDPEDNELVSAYGVKVTDEAGDTVYSGILRERSYAAYTLDDGIYTIEVTARNELFPDVVEASDVTSMQVSVTSAARYTAEQIDTYDGDFVSLAQSAPNDIQAQYNGSVTVFNSTNVSAWGYIGPKEGITVDMDKNPIAVVRTAGAEGGYFVKASYTGSGGAIDVVGNTSVQYEGDRTLFVKLNETVSGQLSGIKTDYKFLFGCLAAVDSSYKTVCRILLYGIDIVYVKEYIYNPPPQTPEKLNTPAGFELNGSLLSVGAVAGNDQYTPVYDITVSGGEVNVSLQKRAQPVIDLAEYGLKQGTDYTVTVKAVGDGVYYSDSDVASQTVRYGVLATIEDFTSVPITARENGSDITLVSKGADGFTYRVGSGKWGLLALPIPVSGTLTPSSRLIIVYGDVTEGTSIAGRYYRGASGSEFTYNLGGDHLISSGQTEIFGELDSAVIDNGNLYLGIGMGGGDGDRSITVRSITIVDWQLV